MQTDIHFYHVSLSSSWNEKYFSHICRKNQIFNNIFPKITLSVRQCRKIWYSQTGHMSI